MDAEKRKDWDMMLTAPLPGTEKRTPTPAQIEDEGAAFLTAMQQLTGKKA